MRSSVLLPVLPGVALGEGCLVAASSVVTKDVPPRSLASSNPARVLSEDVDGPTELIDRSVFGWNRTRRQFVNVEPVNDRRRVLPGTPAADRDIGHVDVFVIDVSWAAFVRQSKRSLATRPRHGLHAGQPRRIASRLWRAALRPAMSGGTSAMSSDPNG